MQTCLPSALRDLFRESCGPGAAATDLLRNRRRGRRRQRPRGRAPRDGGWACVDGGGARLPRAESFTDGGAGGEGFVDGDEAGDAECLGGGQLFLEIEEGAFGVEDAEVIGDTVA